MFSWNTPIKLFPPQNVAVNSPYFSLYLYFCEFSSNSIFWSILRLGEEFFTRSSHDQNFFRIKKYEVRAFQRRVERTCSPLQCWDILSWTSKSHSTLSFGERFHMSSLLKVLSLTPVQWGEKKTMAYALFFVFPEITPYIWKRSPKLRVEWLFEVQVKISQDWRVAEIRSTRRWKAQTSYFLIV